MSSVLSPEPSGPLGQVSAWLARREALPLSLRAALRFHARSGEFDRTTLRIRERAGDDVDAMIADAFAEVNAAIRSETGFQKPDFSYDTKLTLPVELTLGYVYRRALEEAPPGTDPFDSDDHLDDDGGLDGDSEHLERAREVARLCTEALLDGDMRDAINDGEYEDFEVDAPTDEDDHERIARTAQETLNERVTAAFDRYDDAVRAAYEWAVAESERHQADDEYFRELMERAGDGDDEAVAAIETDYRHADFETADPVLTADEQSWPYCKTQYERVGVIYEGMVEMFRAAGIEIDAEFERSLVLSTIGAQIWLDDVDDLAADRRDGQLTPVTAEYLVADTDREAYERIVDVTTQYLERAIEYAIVSEAPMTGIATEYIYLSGDPETLPGSVDGH